MIKEHILELGVGWIRGWDVLSLCFRCVSGGVELVSECVEARGILCLVMRNGSMWRDIGSLKKSE